MTLSELKELVDKKIKHYLKDAEVIIDGDKLDNVVDMWLLANGKELSAVRLWKCSLK